MDANFLRCKGSTFDFTELMYDRRKYFLSFLNVIFLMLKGLKQAEHQFLTNKEKISTVNTCENTSNQPPTPTGQTHRKKYTTSKAYQNHGGRFVTGKIFILTDVIINTDYT